MENGGIFIKKRTLNYRELMIIIMEGDLESIIEPLIVEQQTNQLTELNDTLA